MGTPSVTTESPPRLSIGLPVYNGERWLEETLQSLRSQTLENFELIISDNASTDGTQAICTRHAAEDWRIWYHRNAQNIGGVRNHMTVLALARAAYFKWAAANDLCDPRFLECCVAALEAEPAAVLAYPTTVMFSDDPADTVPYEEDIAAMQDSAADRFAHVLCKSGWNNAVYGVMRTHMLRRAHPQGSFHGSDIVLMGELALFGKFVRIPEPLFHRRTTKGSFTMLLPRSERDRFFEPNATSPLRWQTWKYLWGVSRAALFSAPLGPEKAAAAIFALKWMVWNRSNLMNDLMSVMRNVP